MLTADCNLRCRYCYQRKKEAYMDKETIKQSVDFFNQNTKSNEPVIHIFGGEPFLAPENMDFLFDYALKSNDKIRFEIITNGTLLNDKIKKLLKNYKSVIKKLIISVNGYKEYHDTERIYADGNGSWDDVMKNIPFFLKHFPNLRAECRFDARKIRKEDLLKGVEQLYSIGISEVSFAPVEGSLTSSGYQTFKAGCLDAVKWYINKCEQGEGVYIPAIASRVRQINRKGNLPCGAALNEIFIYCDGSIYPCTGYFAANKNKLGTVFKPNYERMALFRQIITVGHDKNKKYFVCPLTKINELRYSTNSIEEITKEARIYEEVLSAFKRRVHKIKVT